MRVSGDYLVVSATDLSGLVFRGIQGQQAPIVIYSTASSSVEEAPRGMEFLFSPNRTNVASWAKCVGVGEGADISAGVMFAGRRIGRHMPSPGAVDA